MFTAFMELGTPVLSNVSSFAGIVVVCHETGASQKPEKFKLLTYFPDL